jgi:hypothetical protein
MQKGDEKGWSKWIKSFQLDSSKADREAERRQKAARFHEFDTKWSGLVIQDNHHMQFFRPALLWMESAGCVLHGGHKSQLFNMDAGERDTQPAGATLEYPLGVGGGQRHGWDFAREPPPDYPAAPIITLGGSGKEKYFEPLVAAPELARVMQHAEQVRAARAVDVDHTTGLWRGDATWGCRALWECLPPNFWTVNVFYLLP